MNDVNGINDYYKQQYYKKEFDRPYSDSSLKFHMADLFPSSSAPLTTASASKKPHYACSSFGSSGFCAGFGLCCSKLSNTASISRFLSHFDKSILSLL